MKNKIINLEDLSAFADDNYSIKTNNDLLLLKSSMEASISSIANWLKSSGLKVNDEKTEDCLFSRNDSTISAR